MNKKILEIIHDTIKWYKEGLENFEEKYIQLLEAGGSIRYRELLQPFNLDPSQPNFWHKGISVIESFIDQLNEIN